MSIVHLSSVGQNPANFSNEFPMQINLAPNSQVKCLGYSGMMADFTASAGRDIAEFITIRKDINDALVVYHGPVAAGTPVEEEQNRAFVVKVPPGTYSTMQPAGPNPEFAQVLQKAFNDCETTQEFYRGGATPNSGWVVTWTGAPTNRYNIQLIEGRNRRTQPGFWEQYINNGGGKITPPATIAGATTLSPHPSVANNQTVNRYFVNKREGFNGALWDTTTALPGATSFGYTMAFTASATTTYKDMSITHGIVPVSSLSVWDQYSSEATNWAGNATGYGDMAVNIVRNQDKPNGFVDWAFPNAIYPWVAFGMTINPDDGRIGIITSAMSNDDGDGQLKQPLNQDVSWTDYAVHLTAGQQQKLHISPRFDAADKTYDLLFLYDDGTGAGYITVEHLSMGSYSESAATNGIMMELLSAQHVYHVVAYSEEHYTSTSLDVNMTTTNKWDNDAGSPFGADPKQPTTIVFQPLSPDVSCPQRLREVAAKLSVEHCGSLGLELGFESIFETSSTQTSDGWNGDDLSLPFVATTPLLVTCPSLPIEGYVGSGARGGASAAILAVEGMRNNMHLSGFSSRQPGEWIDLNNQYNLTLDRLNIKLCDQTNREYVGLAPDFSCWLVFRSPAAKEPTYAVKSVGGLRI